MHNQLAHAIVNYTELYNTTLEYLREHVGVEAQGLVDEIFEIPEEDGLVEYIHTLVTSMEAGKSAELQHLLRYKQKPVDIKTFILDEYYLGLQGKVYPEVMKEVEAMATGEFVEVVLTGAIGTAKTTIAIWLTIYQLYLLSCMHNPQDLYDLIDTDEILIICQSITADLAKKLDYSRMKALIETCQYFRENFYFDKNIESEMRFPHRIIIRPVAGGDTAAIGQNVIGGIIDELNYMAVTKNSKQSIDGGTYDQAIAVYNSIARRRKSRFMRKGVTAGILCLVSSRRYPGQFTDKKEEERERDIKKHGKSTIYVYDKRPWDILPPERFLGTWFSVFVGDEFSQPFIVGEGDSIPEGKDHLVMEVPTEYEAEFEDDIMNAIREIAGVSTLAKNPFMGNTKAVSDCFYDDPYTVLSSTMTDFTTHKLMIRPKHIVSKHPLRWAHIDLAVTGDSAGLVIGHVERFIELERVGGESEIVPVIKIDVSLEIRPPKGGEILFEKVRNILYILKKHGMDIKWVTLDSYESRDTMQILARKGYTCGRQSMDITPVPYMVTKQALYDGRVMIPTHDLLRKELVSLERDAQTGKIDHPANGSKDVADGLAGVVYGLTMRREIWVAHGVAAPNMHQVQNTIRNMENDIHV